MTRLNFKLFFFYQQERTAELRVMSPPLSPLLNQLTDFRGSCPQRSPLHCNYRFSFGNITFSSRCVYSMRNGRITCHVPTSVSF
jgi:hypothetical protein